MTNTAVASVAPRKAATVTHRHRPKPVPEQGIARVLRGKPYIAACIGTDLMAPILFAVQFFLVASLLAAAAVFPAYAVTPPRPDANPQRLAKKVQQETDRFLSKREAEFRNAVTALVKPIASRAVSADDRKQLAAAVKAVRRGNQRQVIMHRAALADPTAIKIVDWMRLRSGIGRLDDFTKFLAENPHWPTKRWVRRRMEQAAFIQGGAVDQLIQLFTRFPPVTGMGQAALASAKLARGDAKAATALARRAWRSNGLSSAVEGGFLQRFGALLAPDDHLARVNHLLAADYSSKRARRTRVASARRLLPFLKDDATRKVVAARIAIYLDAKSADKDLAALPKPAQADPHLRRQLAQRLRRKKRLKAASEMLAKLPAGEASHAAEMDWLMRERLARAMMASRAYKLAFALVRDARPDDANEANVQAFLAGWLALRKLKQPKAALAQFQRFVALADGPLSRSRAAYWLGRTHRALGNRAAAQKAFDRAAGYLDTFHGALARVDRAAPNRKLDLPYPEMPTTADAAAFAKADVIQAAVIAHKAKLPASLVRALFGAFAWRVDNPAQIVLAAQLAEVLGNTQISVRTGKAGVARGHPLYIYAYPIHRFPKFEPLTKPPRPEVILSIARQESEFNTAIVSSAGARGLLQVMPATARGVCRAYRIRCSVSALRSNLSFNAKIAAAYISDQMAIVDGNMILLLTSYNAGPGRTRQWLRNRGDPRKAQYDALDWVYEIPFEETRLYVQKVLSNMQVYRARLGDKTGPVRIDRDLGLSTID
ncbi:MAG: transglycosylase SLT domain-containing protein [Pseudomonadota bacterium]